MKEQFKAPKTTVACTGPVAKLASELNAKADFSFNNSSENRGEEEMMMTAQ